MPFEAPSDKPTVALLEGAKTGDDGWAVDMRYGWSKQEPEYVAQSGESKGSDGGGDGRDGVEMTKV